MTVRSAKPVLAVAVLVVVVAGCDERPGPLREEFGLESAEVLGIEPGEETTIVGTVVGNTIDPCVIDDHPDPCDVGGPQYLHLDVDGASLLVTYSYGEDEECLISLESRPGARGRVGTSVEVFGLARGQGEFSGEIDVCASEDYYIDILD